MLLPASLLCALPPRPASDFVRRNVNLGRIGSINITHEDKGAAKERDALGSELEQSKSRLQELQQQTTQMMRDRTALNDQINRLKDQVRGRCGGCCLVMHRQPAALPCAAVCHVTSLLLPSIAIAGVMLSTTSMVLNCAQPLKPLHVLLPLDCHPPCASAAGGEGCTACTA